jgi:aspartyl/asparaginyl beta-hydroxylase (cupin superfamily)
MDSKTMAAGLGGQEPKVAVLVDRAQQFMRERRLDEAARAWGEVLALAPDHAQALLHLGQHRLYLKDAAGALPLLERAADADPRNPVIPLNLAFARRALGDADAEMAALTRSLSIDPYFFPALLAKAKLLERGGQRHRAAKVYKDVLTIAPPDDQLSGELRQAIARAREAVEQNAIELERFLEAKLEPVRARHAGEGLARFDETRDIALGRKKAYTQQPSMLLIPRLPPIGFYDRAGFPWLKDLEAATPVIRDELLTVLGEDAARFRPYVDHPEGAPLNQWAELNRSMKWNVFFLWKDGRRIEENCRRCPRFMALLETLPIIGIPNFAPTVLFSVLEPHAHIPAHSGETNARLLIHLPLIVPKGCRFRVGNEIREWREGEAWVFDDTMEHEAWNDSDETRVIAMIDTWNPLLTAAERELVSGLLNGLSAYYEG